MCQEVKNKKLTIEEQSRTLNHEKVFTIRSQAQRILKDRGYWSAIVGISKNPRFQRTIPWVSACWKYNRSNM